MFLNFCGLDYLRQVLAQEKRVEIEYKTVLQANTWRRNMYQAVEYQGWQAREGCYVLYGY